MVKFIFGILIGILCIIFFIQNGEVVSITFLPWTVTLPRFLLMSIFLLAGVFIGWLFSSFSYFKKRKREKK